MKKLNIKDLPQDYPYPAIWRGKANEHNLDPGETVFGSPFVGLSGALFISTFEIEADGMLFDVGRYEIDPETLSQCTGRHDRNGDLIFVGDILRAEWNENERAIFHLYPKDQRGFYGKHEITGDLYQLDAFVDFCNIHDKQ